MIFLLVFHIVIELNYTSYILYYKVYYLYTNNKDNRFRVKSSYNIFNKYFGLSI